MIKELSFPNKYFVDDVFVMYQLFISLYGGYVNFNKMQKGF